MLWGSRGVIKRSKHADSKKDAIFWTKYSNTTKTEERLVLRENLVQIVELFLVEIISQLKLKYRRGEKNTKKMDGGKATEKCEFQKIENRQKKHVCVSLSPGEPPPLM